MRRTRRKTLSPTIALHEETAGVLYRYSLNGMRRTRRKTPSPTIAIHVKTAGCTV
jgi:hypothetical protein